MWQLKFYKFNPALSLPYVAYAEGVSGGVAKEKEEDPYGGSTDEESDMETDIGECVCVCVCVLGGERGE